MPIIDGPEITQTYERNDFAEWELEMTDNNLRGETLPKGDYLYLGTTDEVLLSLLSGSEERKLQRIHSAWSGKISTRNHTAELSKKRQEVLRPESLDYYYVKASHSARTRCIDGRCIEHYGETADTSADRELGAQTPGGTVTAALCDRIAAWDTIHTDDFNLISDIDRINELFDKLGFVSGGHIDDHAPENMTGCGAIDRVPEILSKITDPNYQEQLRELTKQVLGDEYNGEVADAIVGRLLSLEGMSDEYFKKDESGNLLYRKEAIKALQKDNPNGVSKLVGEHKEIAIVLNLIPGTTFHRDQFSVDNNNELQLFNYDFWRTLEVADALHPTNTGDPANDILNAHLRSRFVTARTLFALGTCMVLTDGSLDLIVRQPSVKE